MKRFILVLLTLPLSIVLFGCNSNTTQEPQYKEQIERKSALKMVNISFYNEKSFKGQPELANVISDKSELNNMEELLFTHGTSSKIKPSEVKKLFLLGYYYEKDKKVANSRYLLFLISQDGMNYAKEIEIDPRYNLEKFSDKDIPLILEQAGLDNWYTIPIMPF